MMLKCGLLGEKLGHSYSPAIHAMLGDYEYKLYERSRDELEDFLLHGNWDGLNVTIPYKKAVLPYCSELSERARRIGSVNTLVRRPDGSLYGDNTDAYGFEKLIRRAQIPVQNKKALVLGSGGASVMACEVLRELGAGQVIVISRTGENNYDNLDRHRDAQLIINTTPLGMYPNNGTAAVNLRSFPDCEGVLDVVYNPARTALILQAEKLNIPCASGLYMLVGQAKRSSEQFQKKQIPDTEIERIQRELSAGMQNIILIGMPGCGKSTVASALGKMTGRPVYEADAAVEERAGCTIPEIFTRDGEETFRRLEHEVLADLGKLSGAIISTGGGCVTRAENYDLLHQNGRIFWLQREIGKLEKTGRPLSLKNDLNELYEIRKPFYEGFADRIVANDRSADETAAQIVEDMR